MDEPENLSSTQDVQSSGEESQESLSLAHPTKIGRYTILGRLGKGGFGEVFQGYDDDLDRQVAIKVPRPERVSRPEDIEAYLNEARIVASLDHPHIVPVYDVGRTDDGLCFVVSKLIEGSDLAKRIKEARPVFTSLLHWLRRSQKLFITLILVAWSTGMSNPPTSRSTFQGRHLLPISVLRSETRTSARVAGSLGRLIT
jgi:hypothetical protein